MSQIPNLGPGALGSVPPAQYGLQTPNLQLNLDVPAASAQNFQILDNLSNSSYLPAIPGSFFISAGHENPAICAVAYEPCVTTPNDVNCFLFSLDLAVQVNRVSIYVGVGQAGATMNAGIYSSTGALLVDSGPLAASGSGALVVSANTSMGINLPGGTWYYYAFSCTSTTPTFLAMNQNMLGAYALLRGVALRSVLASTPLANGALPLTMGNIPTLNAADVVYHPATLFSSR